MERIKYNEDGSFYTLIEITMNDQPVKYEYDKKTGYMSVDRFMHTPMRYPHNYGFIPNTLSEDGDAVDVLVITGVPLFQNTLIKCVPIGVMYMEDEKGNDEKILAIPHPDLKPFYNVKNYTELPPNIIPEIEQFFFHYKNLEENKHVNIRGFGDYMEAHKIIASGFEKFQKK